MRSWLQGGWVYLAGGLLAAGLFVGLFGVGGADWRVPFRTHPPYHHDAEYFQVLVQNVLDCGDPGRSDRCAAPFGYDTASNPISDAVHVGLVRFLGLFTRRVGLVINLYYLLTFVLAAVAATFALRRLGRSRPAALVGGLLFAFLPYHFWLGQHHLFLSGYFMIPLLLLVAVRLLEGRFSDAEHAPGRRRLWAFALVVAAVGSSTGVYYAFFGSFFLLAAALGAAWRQGSWRPLVPGVVLVGVVTAGLLANILPTLSRLRGAEKAEVVTRYTSEADIYALNLSQLVLPRADHRLPLLRRMKERYNQTPYRPVVNDLGSSLGCVALVGLCFVLLSALFPRPSDGPRQESALGALALAGALLGTVAGAGSLFAFFASPLIRCYNRVSVFVAFLALAGAMMLLDRLAEVFARWRRPWLAPAACGCVLVFGLWDQTSPADRPPRRENETADRQVKQFCRSVEAQLPAGAAVFQLPYCVFPDSLVVGRMGPYDHFRIPLHAARLRFSHGVQKGTPTDARLQGVVALPVGGMVAELTRMGYAGVHVDRAGYADNGAAVVEGLRKALGSEPTEAENGRDLFFALPGGATARGGP